MSCLSAGRVAVRGAAAGLLVGFAGVAACTAELAPPFQITGTGDIEGFVFFDSDADGRYDPGRGDQVLAGVGVELRERGTERVLAGGETVTNSQGRFFFSGVPAGTHHVFVDTLALSEMALCRNPVPASVYFNETQFIEVTAQRGCVITIRDAKDQALGAFVIVEGVVTVAQGSHRPDNIYLQDRTAGIQVFGVPGGMGLVVGDSVRVMGDLGHFNQELQIVLPSLTLVGDGTPIEPREVTGAEINARTFEGELVIARNAELRSVGSADGLGRHNVVLEAADGVEFQVRIEGGVVPDMPTTAWQVGATYDVTGALGSFQGTAQMKPRSGADIQLVD